MDGKQTLFQRVVIRPGATLHPAPNPQRPTPVAGFSVFYVYTRQGDWAELGVSADGATQGWMRTAEMIDWPHALIGAFSNPAGRQPVLFLDTSDNERALLNAPDTGAQATQLLTAARANHPGPVIAIEPANFIDISRQFYFLPILHAETLDTDSGATLRLLEIVSAPAAAPPAAPPPPPQPMHDFRAGLVFVIETNISMQPYIDSTRAAVKTIIDRIAASPVSAAFRFGVVGFRDSLQDTPKLEYTTHLFARPDFEQQADQVLEPLGTVREASISSNSFDEDPIAGLKAAIEEIDWSPLGGRYIVLITHAGAREANHPHSATHLGIPEIRALAQARGIAIFVVHLLTPIGAQFHNHEKAAAQYKALSQTDGAGSLYFPVPGGRRDAYQATVVRLTDLLLQQVATSIGSQPPTQPAAPAADATDAQMARQVAVVSQAMRLAYLGRVEHTRAPDVVRGFTTDRDLVDVTRHSLEVRVLLTRNQLSDLAQALQNILQAGLASRIDPAKFFDQLRAAFAVAARDPQQIAHIDRIGGLLGEYLDGLPYHSDLMNIRPEDWLAMGGIAQSDILGGVEAKLRLFQEFQSQPDLWVNLAGADHPGEAAYPVPIDALP